MSDRTRKSVLAEFRTHLGKVPDQQIADQANVSRTLVVNYRKKLGIPAYQGHRVSPSKPEAEPERPFRGRRSALDPFVTLLGEKPDSEIARLANVTAENVRTYRQRRGIPARWPEAPRSADSPAPSPAAPSRAKAPSPVVPPASIDAAPLAAGPAATASVSRARPTAWLVVVDTEEGSRSYALVAQDIASAATTALTRLHARHPTATIQSIQRVAELFPA